MAEGDAGGLSGNIYEEVTSRGRAYHRLTSSKTVPQVNTGAAALLICRLPQGGKMKNPKEGKKKIKF